MNIEMKSVLLPEQALLQAKPLLGFDYDGQLYHVMLFDFGDDGGAIGVQREGSNFVARITLDSLAAFAEQAHLSAGSRVKQ